MYMHKIGIEIEIGIKQSNIKGICKADEKLKTICFTYTHSCLQQNAS